MYDRVARYRFPKRHEFVVNECRVLDVRDVLAWLKVEYPAALRHSIVEVPRFFDSERQKSMREAAECRECDGYGCPECRHTGYRKGCSDFVKQPRDLRVVRRLSGATWRWYLLCQNCNRRCEHLYLLPGESGYREDNSPRAPHRGDWCCRICLNLNYASQHYGRRRALADPLPPRRAVSCRGRYALRNMRGVTARSSL